MPVTALNEYNFPPVDAEANFHGNWMLFVHWERHLMFCNPLAVMAGPEMLWDAFLTSVLAPCYSRHPQFALINWSTVMWVLDEGPVAPVPGMTLRDAGVGHKSMLSFSTPGLEGLSNAAF